MITKRILVLSLSAVLAVGMIGVAAGGGIASQKAGSCKLCGIK